MKKLSMGVVAALIAVTAPTSQMITNNRGYKKESWQSHGKRPKPKQR